MTNGLSIFNQLRPVTVGFDNMFDHFERMFDGDVATFQTQVNFPPYNIVKTGDFTYDVELALAGFSKDDIEVELTDGNLAVRSKENADKDDNDSFVHKGIAKRSFMRQFTLSDDIVVKGADLKDGLLVIDLERVIPEEKKPRLIQIGS